MRRSYLIPFALVAVAAFAQEEEEVASDEVAAPQIVAFTITDGSAPSRELESAVGKLRLGYDERPVLFLTVNLATAGGKNQAEMLFFSLGLPQLWEECRKSPGQLVLVDLDTVNVLSKHGAKEDLKAAIEKQIAAEDEGGAGGDEEGCGCDEGSGSGD